MTDTHGEATTEPALITSMSAQNRQPQGQPTGGQFAAQQHSDAAVTLDRGPAVITSRVELAVALREHPAELRVDFSDRKGVRLTARNVYPTKIVVLGGDIAVEGIDVEARGTSIIRASRRANVRAYDNAEVFMDDGNVETYGNATATIAGGSHGIARGASVITFDETSSAAAIEAAKVREAPSNKA